MFLVDVSYKMDLVLNKQNKKLNWSIIEHIICKIWLFCDQQNW